MTSTNCELIELFSAIQGEGPIIGQRQIFVRFGKCDVKCDYCDTPLCHVPVSHCKIEAKTALRDFERHENPISVAQLATWIQRLAQPQGMHHSLALTGGEPLLHARTISALRPLLDRAELPFYLETDGHLVTELESVLGDIDLVGMDIKIESATGFAPQFENNRRFLAAISNANLSVFVKIVLCEETSEEELLTALSVVRDVAPNTKTVLQPVTPFAGCGVPPRPDRLLRLDQVARGMLPNVVVIPQTHKMLNQL